MKRFSLIFSLTILALLCSVERPARAAGRINQKLTVTAGTPIQIAPTGTIADEVVIQPAAGGTVSLVYVMAGIYGRTPSTSNATDVTTTLCPATATIPGCSYSDGTLAQPATGVDVGAIWIDVGTSSTVVYVSYQPRG